MPDPDPAIHPGSDPRPYSLAATARSAPDKPAAAGTRPGPATTFAELDDRSRDIAALLHARGLAPGDHIAVLMDNTPRYFDVVWGAQRSGLYTTPINAHLTAEEAAFIVGDCGAKALFASPALATTAGVAAGLSRLTNLFSVGGPVEGFEDLDDVLCAGPTMTAPPEREGAIMFYSSGTTGRPKGVMRPLTDAAFGAAAPMYDMLRRHYGVDQDAVYLCPAPLYHAGPLTWSMMVQRLGGTVVVMPRFDALETLRVIEEHGVTHAQFVPTMFVRLLRLSPQERARYSTDSLKVAIHSAAPCPVDVKERMIAWWGEKIWESYGGSEAIGNCAVDSATWLRRKGTVGRPTVGVVHILDDDGNELPAGEVGTIYFEGTNAFEYHNDPEKTASAFNARGWATLGDVGHVDEDGYLYLSDRRSDLIISGGVNIYPQEVENLLIGHPKVVDVAVIGVPDAEMSQSVKAVVQTENPDDAGPELAAELIEYCRERLAHFKCPRSVDFDPELPRLPNGKLMKRRLAEHYEPINQANSK